MLMSMVDWGISTWYTLSFTGPWWPSDTSCGGGCATGNPHQERQNPMGLHGAHAAKCAECTECNLPSERASEAPAEAERSQLCGCVYQVKGNFVSTSSTNLVKFVSCRRSSRRLRRSQSWHRPRSTRRWQAFLKLLLIYRTVLRIMTSHLFRYNSFRADNLLTSTRSLWLPCTQRSTLDLHPCFRHQMWHSVLQLCTQRMAISPFWKMR